MVNHGLCVFHAEESDVHQKELNNELSAAVRHDNVGNSLWYDRTIEKVDRFMRSRCLPCRHFSEELCVVVSSYDRKLVFMLCLWQ